MPGSIPARRAAMLGAVLLLAVAVSVSASADKFRLLQPVRSDSMSYSDENIVISFTMRPGYMGIGYEGIGFTITNKSTSAIAIDWNRTSMTLPDGQTSNIIHEGIKFISAGSSLPPTTIPPGGRLSDSAIPTRNISYIEGWYVSPMAMEPGSQFGLYLALDRAGTPRCYNFVFEAVEAKPPTASFEITEWTQGYYEFSGEYSSYVYVYFKVTNTGTVDIDYYRVWIEVTCADGSKYQEWTNGLNVPCGSYITDYTVINTLKKQVVSVSITNYELTS